MIATPEEVVEYAKTFIGVFYNFGGNCRLTGTDCSATICEILRMPGIVSPKSDYSAKTLLPYLISQGATTVVEPYPKAAILFFGATHPTHVAITVSPTLMLECSGGDETTTDFMAAAAKNAYVKISPIHNRRNLITAVLPRY